MEDKSRIFAIVVTYYPDLPRLMNFIRELCVQFERVIMVDNGTPSHEFISDDILAISQVDLILNGANLGIGAAQNIGIKISLAEGATHVIVFDQDSMISPGFCIQLLNAEIVLKQEGRRVAAVGPKLIDQSTGKIIPFITFVCGVKRRISVTCADQVVECFALLSSGTLMSRESLETVGLLREDLFLEYVDVEWGARARKLGLKSFGVGAATLLHNLGDQRLSVGPIIVPLHSPLRHYYTMRNAILMQKDPAFPFYWKFHDVIRTVRGFIVFSCFNPPRRQQVKFMLHGLYHGAIGKSGQFKKK